MKQKILLIVLLLHFTFLIRLAAQDTWIQTYQPFGDEVDYFVEDIRVCPDEGYAVIGSIWDSEFSTNNGFMMKTDSNGNLLWASIDTVDFVTGPEPSGFVVLDDGSFITVGNNFWGGGRYLLKRTPEGIIEWTVELDNDYRNEAIELTDDENLITTGSSIDNTIHLQKFNLNGNLIWRQTYLPYGFEYGTGYSVTQTSDSGYALTGSVNGDNSGDIIVLKTDANGDSLWTWSYDGTANSDDAGQCIINNLNNEIIMSGYVSDFNSRDFSGYVVKLSTTGDTIWTTQVSGMYGIISFIQLQSADYLLYGNNLTKIDNTPEIIWQVPHLANLGGSGDREILELYDQKLVYLGKNEWGSHITIIKCDSTGLVTAIDENYIHPLDNNLVCYPNPFNPEITISFNLSNPKDITLQVFNVKGQRIKTLINEQKTIGHHSICWSANEYSSGVYFIQLLQNNELKRIQKVSLIK